MEQALASLQAIHRSLSELDVVLQTGRQRSKTRAELLSRESVHAYRRARLLHAVQMRDNGAPYEEIAAYLETTKFRAQQLCNYGKQQMRYWEEIKREAQMLPVDDSWESRLFWRAAP